MDTNCIENQLAQVRIDILKFLLDEITSPSHNYLYKTLVRTSIKLENNAKYWGDTH